MNKRYSSMDRYYFGEGQGEVILKKSLFALFFALGTGFGAQMRMPLPFTPVPLTLQTFFVLSSGVALGPFWGLLSQALYLLLGIAGFPYFTGWAAGGKTLIGTTGGYLLGFLLASYIAGIFTRRGESKSAYLGMFLGNLVIYLLGASWLGFLLSLSFSQALLKGVLPFLAGDILKILAGGPFAAYISRWTR